MHKKQYIFKSLKYFLLPLRKQDPTADLGRIGKLPFPGLEKNVKEHR